MVQSDENRREYHRSYYILNRDRILARKSASYVKKPETEFTCAGCGITGETHFPHVQKYCKPCAVALNSEMSRLRLNGLRDNIVRRGPIRERDYTCIICDKQGKTTSRVRKYCAPCGKHVNNERAKARGKRLSAERPKLVMRICEICEKPMSGRRQQRYHYACRNEAKRRLTLGYTKATTLRKSSRRQKDNARKVSKRLLGRPTNQGWITIQSCGADKMEQFIKDNWRG